MSVCIIISFFTRTYFTSDDTEGKEDSKVAKLTLRQNKLGRLLQ